MDTARRAVHRTVEARGDVVAAYVGGSAAGPGADHWADVDLRVVLAGHEVPAGEFVLEAGVPLEWAFVPLRYLTDTEWVRRDPFLAPEIEQALILYDPSGLLLQVQSALRADRAAERYASLRASALLARALERMATVTQAWREAGTLALWDYRCAVFWGVESALIRAGIRPTHRRALVALRDAAATTRAPAIYEGALHALGAAHWTHETALRTWQELRRVLAGLPHELRASHPYLAADRHTLWDSDVCRMIDAGEFREVSLPVWTLLALVWSVSEGVSETRRACASLLAGMGFERPHGVGLHVEESGRWIRGLVDWIGLPDGPTPPQAVASEDAVLSGPTPWLDRRR